MEIEDNDPRHTIKHLLSVIDNLIGTIDEYDAMPCDSLRNRMRQCAHRAILSSKRIKDQIEREEAAQTTKP